MGDPDRAGVEPRSFWHGAMRVGLLMRLSEHLCPKDGQQRPGEGGDRYDVLPGVGVRLAPGLLLAPDVAVWELPESGKWRDGPTAGTYPGNVDGWPAWPPLLAVEIPTSQRDRASVLTTVDAYLGAGVRLVWVIRAGYDAAVWRAGVPGYSRRGPDGFLDGLDVLPGFSVRVRDVWEKE